MLPSILTRFCRFHLVSFALPRLVFKFYDVMREYGLLLEEIGHTISGNSGSYSLCVIVISLVKSWLLWRTSAMVFGVLLKQKLETECSALVKAIESEMVTGAFLPHQWVIDLWGNDDLCRLLSLLLLPTFSSLALLAGGSSCSLGLDLCG